MRPTGLFICFPTWSRSKTRHHPGSHSTVCSIFWQRPLYLSGLLSSAYSEPECHPCTSFHWAGFYLWMGPLGLTGDQGPPLPGLALQNPATPPGQLLTPTSVSHTQASDTVPSCTWIVELVPGTGSHWLVHVLCGSSSDCRTPAMWKQEVLFTWKQHCKQLFSSNKAIFSTKIKFKMCRI